jgi:hypothetical protein
MEPWKPRGQSTSKRQLTTSARQVRRGMEASKSFVFVSMHVKVTLAGAVWWRGEAESKSVVS